MNKKKQMVQQFQTYISTNRNAHFRLAYSYSRHQEDAWDIVHESIVKALKAIDKSKYPEALNSWFYRILVNTSLDFLRRNKKFVQYDQESIENKLETVDQYVDFDLQDALDKLPTEIKTIIVLRYFEDMKITDIAKVLDENENTLKTKLYKGLKLLRIELQEDSNGSI